MLVIFVVMLVAIGHIGIMLIEMFASPEQQARAFDLPVEFTRQRKRGYRLLTREFIMVRWG